MEKTLVVRLPKELDDFLEIASKSKYMNKSVYIRELIRKDWMCEIDKSSKMLGTGVYNEEA